MEHDPVAVEQRAFGLPREVVSVVRAEARALAAGEVAVRLAFAPINPADLLRLRGEALRAALPSVAGGEGAGWVTACGAGVTSHRVGDLVLLPAGRTWAEHQIHRAEDVTVLPAGTPPEQAAMLAINPMTASCLLDVRALRAGDWIIQNAAGSAVSRLVEKLAVKRGVRVIDVVRDETSAASLGADASSVTLVGEERLAERVKAATGGAMPVLALDAVAGASSAAMASALADGALLVVYGLLSGKPIELPTARIVFEGIEVRGFSRVRAVRAMGKDAARERYAELARAVTEGWLASAVEATYTIDRILDALAHAERPGRRGKILLRPR